jgi:hypothetical protein
MLMGLKDFLAPTRGRILLFVILFVLIFIYDTMFAPFPGSPVVDNLATQEGASSFVLYILIMPYILSALLPAFAGLRKRKFLRLSRLSEFMHHRSVPQSQKPSRQQTFTFPTGTPVMESNAPVSAATGEVSPKQPRKPTSQKKKPKPKKK